MSTDSTSTQVILLLEDNEGLARALKRVLEIEGFRVLHAIDGRRARALIEEVDHVDLLLADLNLPGIGGREVANLILAHHPEVRVLYTTGSPQSDPVLRDLMAAGYPVLRKPYDAPEFVAAIRKALSD